MKIYNLSSHSLTGAELSLLKKGLGFSPSIGPNQFGLFKDLNRFIRTLTLRRHFSIETGPDLRAPVPLNSTQPADENALSLLQDLWLESNMDEQYSLLPLDPEILHTDLKPKSKFNPIHSKGPYIETYYQAVYKDFVDLCKNYKNKSENLNNMEKQALKGLNANKGIIIKQADKGGSLVIQNRQDYINEGNRLLSDPSTYISLPSDPLPIFQLELKLLIEEAWNDGVLTKKEKSFMLPDVCSTPYFYHLPKVHKSLTNPPGRPIVAGTDSFTNGLSQYIDLWLQPFVQALPSYIKDSNHVIEQLEKYLWIEGYMWASLDVSSLYTSIPHQVGLSAVQHFLVKDGNVNSRQARFLVEGTKFCLTHNYFTFLDQFYLQCKGTAMGANFAPGYANLTMGHWEELNIWSNNPYARHLIFYGRYIDDILIIWDGGPDAFSSFVAHCNNNSMGLSFTHVLDSEELVFLDLTLSHDATTIVTSNHVKPTGGNSYLHYTSCHHPSWKKNIPKGQFRRLRRNCSRIRDYETQGALMARKFHEKGYPEHLVREAFETQKSPLKIQRKKKRNESNTVRFITDYNNQFKEISRIISKHFNILKLDKRLSPLLPTVPQVTFRRARTMKNILAPSKLKTKISGPLGDIRTYFDDRVGVYRCKKRGCLTCQFITHGKTSLQDSSGNTFHIKQFITCSTDFVIYILKCSCNLLYVGRTIRPMRKRIGEHRRFITKGDVEHSVPRHFLSKHNKDTKNLEVMAIEAIPKGTLTDNERFSLLCKRETFWIFKLGSLTPGGLNEELELNTVV